MVTTLGTSVFAVGIIEGLAESTALIVKVFSGILSDHVGKRKGLAVFGYALGVLTNPLFALASSTGIVLTARCSTESEKAYAVRHVMRRSQILRRRIYGALRLACARLWILSALF